MLNLAQLQQVGLVEKPDEYEITATCVTAVPNCECGSTELLRNGTKDVSFVDTPMHGKRVVIVVKRQRFICKGCRATVYPDIPHVHEKRRMTLRCYDYITKNGTKRSWKALGDEIGIDAQTVSDIWNDWADVELAKITPVTPDWMGIDELHIMGKFRAVITNIRQKALVTMLPDRDIGTLHAYFLGNFEPARVECVTMDMWDPYRQVVKERFPKARIVVDRFHVMRYASDAVETTRKAVRGQLDKQRRVGLLGDRWLFLSARENLSPMQTMKLEAVLEQYPTIRDAYFLKEGFRDVWKTGNRQEAEATCEEWKKRVAASTCADAFRPLIRALGNWHEEIFAYMDWRLTNAYTEGFNAMARRMDRTGNGYSFEGLKKRLIMAHGLQFREKPVVNFHMAPGAPKGAWYAEKVKRQLFPRHTWKVVGCRFSTLVRVAPKLPAFG